MILAGAVFAHAAIISNANGLGFIGIPASLVLLIIGLVTWFDSRTSDK